MTTNSPDCIWAESEHDTCLALGYAQHMCCSACLQVAKERLVEAIFPDGPPEGKSTVDEGTEYLETGAGAPPTEAEAEYLMNAKDLPEAKILSEEPGDIGPKEVASFDLPSSSFPFDLVWIDRESHEVRYKMRVVEPGEFNIPNFDNCDVVVSCDDGTVIRSS